MKDNVFNLKRFKKKPVALQLLFKVTKIFLKTY